MKTAVDIIYSDPYIMLKIIQEITSINDRANLSKSSRWLYYLTSYAKYTDEDPYTNKMFSIYFADKDPLYGSRIYVNACGYLRTFYYFDDDAKNLRNNEKILSLARKCSKYVKNLSIRYAVISYDNSFKMLHCHVQLHRELIYIYRDAEVVSLINSESVSDVLKHLSVVRPKIACFHNDALNFHSINGSFIENSQTLGELITSELETMVWSENLYRLTGIFSKILSLRQTNFKLKKIDFNLLKTPLREDEPTLQLTVLNMLYHMTNSMAFTFMPTDIIKVSQNLFIAKKFEELVIKVDCLDDLDVLPAVLHHMLRCFLHKTETFKLFLNEKIIKQLITEENQTFTIFLELVLFECSNLVELNLTSVIKKKFRLCGEQLMNLIYVLPSSLVKLTLKECDTLTIKHLKQLADKCPSLRYINLSKLTHDSLLIPDVIKLFPRLRHFSLEEANLVVRDSFLRYFEEIIERPQNEKMVDFDVLIMSGFGSGMPKRLEMMMKEFPRPMNFARLLRCRDDVDYELVISNNEMAFDEMYNGEFIHFGQCKYCKYFENYTFET
uniref:F-box domain-containing protein n=1 Tax=Strongyloides papillosus TaxID=174720 RepID=A0A0N5BL62_STREA